jgi:hypothetical protein
MPEWDELSMGTAKKRAPVALDWMGCGVVSAFEEF